MNYEYNEIRYKEVCRLLLRAEEEIADLKREKMRRFNNDECWMWDMDGNNYIDSLVCPIVIRPSQLEAIMLHLIDEVTEDAGLGFYSTEKRNQLMSKVKSLRNEEAREWGKGNYE